jgi:branched-chain amino acid transport system permease protein
MLQIQSLCNVLTLELVNNMVQSILDAISLGGLYSLAALGLGLVFGVMRLVNFAHAELITIAAYTLVLTAQFPLALSLIFTVLVTVFVALLMEFSVYRRLRGVNPAVMLIASFGLSIVLQRVYELMFGALPRSAVVAPFLRGDFKVAGLSITISSIITIVLTIVILLAMGYLIERTSLGLQLRAASADFKTARLLGVRSNRLISAAFGLSGVLAACVALILVIQNPQISPYYGLNITILSLVGIVIGGIASLRGAALGGFIVGVVLSSLNTLLGNGRVYAYSWLFILVLVILLVRPGGLLSKGSELERV